MERLDRISEGRGPPSGRSFLHVKHVELRVLGTSGSTMERPAAAARLNPTKHFVNRHLYVVPFESRTILILLSGLETGNELLRDAAKIVTTTVKMESTANGMF
jgi:hypothetical protein